MFGRAERSLHARTGREHQPARNRAGSEVIKAWLQHYLPNRASTCGPTPLSRGPNPGAYKVPDRIPLAVSPDWEAASRARVLPPGLLASGKLVR